MNLLTSIRPDTQHALHHARQVPEPMSRQRGAKLIEGLHDRGTDRLLNDLRTIPAQRVLSCGKTTPRV